MSDDDLSLLAKVIRDPRITDYGGIWNAIRAAGPRASTLREPMIDRIASLDLAMREQPKAIGRVLDQLPPGTFAKLTESERAVLADPDRRYLAAGLISRQADRGAPAIPLLLDILEFHLRAIADAVRERRSSGDENMVVVDRVRMALCTLGPDARNALPRIDQMAASGLIDRRFAEHRDWHFMLARIGRPIDSIPKPADRGGTEAQFHDSLRRRLDNYRPDRDCGPQWS